jgi:hypothetical protein
MSSDSPVKFIVIDEVAVKRDGLELPFKEWGLKHDIDLTKPIAAEGGLMGSYTFSVRGERFVASKRYWKPYRRGVNLDEYL